MDFRLPKGTTIERFWDNSERKFYVPHGQQTKREFPFLASGRFYRVTDKSHGGNFAKYDPNYKKALPYLATVPGRPGLSRGARKRAHHRAGMGPHAVRPGPEGRRPRLRARSRCHPRTCPRGALPAARAAR